MYVRKYNFCQQTAVRILKTTLLLIQLNPLHRSMDNFCQQTAVGTLKEIYENIRTEKVWYVHCLPKINLYGIT